MANFFFFTDIDLLQAQTQSQAFGVGTGSSTYDEFQLTSIHSATSDPVAYAVCDGILLVQQSIDSSLLNLIIKPTQQPPFAFPKIKYIIYRGIKKESLIAGTIIGAETLNDLTKSIWTSQKALDKSQKNVTATTPISDALGYDLSTSIADTISLDEAFYRTGSSSQLPLVKAGWSIGTFNATSFGIEILIESVGFDPTFEIARKTVNTIHVDKIDETATQAVFFEHWHDKEYILNYIDPCAFFGSFYNFKLKVYGSGSTHKKSGNSLYDDVLKGTHTSTTDSNFYNCNTIYIDIRNEFNYSFNYFKNYDTDIQTAFDSTTELTTKNYYASGWPLMTIQNADFTNNNTSSNPNKIRLAMPDGNGDNPLPMMYVSTGYLQDTYPREPMDKAKMIDMTVTDGLTDEIVLAVPNRKDQTITTLISTYIKLKYFKRFDPDAETPPVSSGTVIRAGNYLDCLFAPFDMKIPFAGNDNITSVIYNEEVFVDATKESNIDFINSIGIARDSANINFVAFPQIIRNNINENEPAIYCISGSSTNDVIDYFEYISQKTDSKIRKSQFELATENIEYIEFSKNEENNSELNTPNVDHITGLVFDEKTDWENIKSLIDSNTVFATKYRVFLGCINPESNVDDKGYLYISHDVVLRGFKLNADHLEVLDINTNIKIYSNATI